jgi:hypothetical protein
MAIRFARQCPRDRAALVIGRDAMAVGLSRISGFHAGTGESAECLYRSSRLRCRSRHGRGSADAQISMSHMRGTCGRRGLGNEPVRPRGPIAGSAGFIGFASKPRSSRKLSRHSQAYRQRPGRLARVASILRAADGRFDTVHVKCHSWHICRSTAWCGNTRFCGRAARICASSARRSPRPRFYFCRVALAGSWHQYPCAVNPGRCLAIAREQTHSSQH